MDSLAVLVGVVILAFVAWELTETWRLRVSAKRKRERQAAAHDRGEDDY